MEQDNSNNIRREPVFSMKLRAGRKRTYFFDIRTTKNNDYYLTITESKKRYNEDGYERHKIFLYKEDFNKFINILTETTDHVKTELLPDYDFDEFNRGDEYKPRTDDKKEEKITDSGDSKKEKVSDTKDSKEETPADEVKETVEATTEDKMDW